jgi:ribosomal protein S18 acetylase RimI-like enzyme
MEEIRTLSGFTTEELYGAFSAAFAGYERSWTYPEFAEMLRRNGFNPSISFGAFKNEKLVAFLLNGEGKHKGLRSVYDTGTGTIPEFQNQGFGKKLLSHAVQFLIKARFQQYVLEVLQKNNSAVRLYEGMGFRVSNEFNYLVKPVSEIRTYEKICMRVTR